MTELIQGSHNIFTTDRDELAFLDLPNTQKPARAVATLLHDSRVKCIDVQSYHIMRWLVDERHTPPVFFGSVGGPPPDAILIEPARVYCPASIKFPGNEERYYAVGNTDPFLVYVRRSLLQDGAVIGLLPNFIGWLQAIGLALQVRSSGSALRLHGIVRAEGIAVPDLVVAVDGRPILRVDLAGVDTREFTVDFTVPSGDRWVVFQSATFARLSEHMNFVKLQFFNSMETPGALFAADSRLARR